MSGTGTAWEKWTRVIREQRASGLSVAAFCAGRGIAESSFYPWKRKLAGERDAGPPGPAFVEATIRAVAEDRGGVTIEVGAQGRRVIVRRGFDRQLLLEVIEALESGWGGPGGTP